MKKDEILVVGMGYVGLSNAVLLSKKYNVTVTDIDKSKVELLKNKISPIKDELLSDYLKNKSLNLNAKYMEDSDYLNKDYIIMALPTNYDEKSNYFNTKILDEAIRLATKLNKDATIIIKSTIPVGFTEKVNRINKTDKVIFMPEFLREGSGMYDSLFPTRIIVGTDVISGEPALNLFLKCCKTTTAMQMSSKEAECVKLFSNSFLALRVAFFNELDMFSEINKLTTKNIIDGVSSDPRIGNHYNNPSFGFGGYCLPKDTKQLAADFQDVPNSLISGIVESNKKRIDYVANKINDMNINVLGVYKLSMKKGSDNFRSSSIIEVMKKVKKCKVLIYDPAIQEGEILDYKVMHDLEEFKENCDLIISNRYENELEDVKKKLYCRDVYGLG